MSRSNRSSRRRRRQRIRGPGTSQSRPTPDPKPSGADQPDRDSGTSTQKKSHRSAWVRAHSTELAIAVVGTLIGIAVTWYIAPWQEVRADRAVQTAKSKTAQAGQPLRVQPSYAFIPEDGIVFAVPGHLTSHQVAQLTESGASYPAIKENLPRDALQIAYPPPAFTRPENLMMTRLRVLLEGRRESSLLIKQLSARITKRTPPLSGAFVNGPPQGEGDIVQVGFDLDSGDLGARKVAEDGTLQSRYFDSKFITLQHGEQIPMAITAYAARFYYEWVIDIVVWADGRDQTMIIDDNGRPFRTTALASHYDTEFEYRFPKGRFEQVTPKARPQP